MWWAVLVLAVALGSEPAVEPVVEPVVAEAGRAVVVEAGGVIVLADGHRLQVDGIVHEHRRGAQATIAEVRVGDRKELTSVPGQIVDVEVVWTMLAEQGGQLTVRADPLELGRPIALHTKVPVTLGTLRFEVARIDGDRVVLGLGAERWANLKPGQTERVGGMRVTLVRSEPPWAIVQVDWPRSGP